jgi:hypothetical protein
MAAPAPVSSYEPRDLRCKFCEKKNKQNRTGLDCQSQRLVIVSRETRESPVVVCRCLDRIGLSSSASTVRCCSKCIALEDFSVKSVGFFSLW